MDGSADRRPPENLRVARPCPQSTVSRRNPPQSLVRQSLAGSPVGAAVLVAVGAGFLSFAAYSMIDVRFRRLKSQVRSLEKASEPQDRLVQNPSAVLHRAERVPQLTFRPSRRIEW
jgi:hypothetical protein